MAELAELLSAVDAPEQAAPPSLSPPPLQSSGRELADIIPAATEDADKLANSVLLSSDFSPDQTARSIKAAERSGLPTKFVEENLDEIEKALESKTFSAANFRERSPKFAEWLSKDPRNVAVAKDDVSALSGVERALWSIKTAAKSVAAGMIPRTASSLWGVPRILEDWVTELAPHNPIALATLALHQANPLSESGMQLAATQAKKYEEIAQQWQGDISGVSGGEQAMYGGFQSLGQMLMTLPLAVITRVKSAALAPMGLMTLGDSYNRAKNAGKGMFESLSLAAPDMVAEVLTERYGVGVLFRDLGLKKSFLTTARNWLVMEGLGEQAATLWQDFNEWMVLNPQKTVREFWDERIPRSIDTFIGTLVAGGGMIALGKTIDLAVNRGRSPAAEEANVFRALGESASESKLLQKVPEKFREFVAHAKQDGPVEHVYIPVERWDALFQEDTGEFDPSRMQTAAADARQAAKELMGSTNAYDEAKNVTNGDLVVPIEAYAEKVAGTDLHARLTPDIRLRMGSLSARESMEIGKQAEDIQQFQEEDGKAAFDAEAPQAQVEKEFFDMVRPFYGESEARRHATVESLRYAARAQRLGISPLELWQAEGPIVQRRLKADAKAMAVNQVDSTTPAFKKWFGDSRVVDADGNPLVVYHGTRSDIQVFGGGLAQMP